jgi:hypothetical protein
MRERAFFTRKRPEVPISYISGGINPKWTLARLGIKSKVLNIYKNDLERKHENTIRSLRPFFSTATQLGTRWTAASFT